MLLPVDRVVNLYLFAIKEHASDKDLVDIDNALEPPSTYRQDGIPSWYGSEDDAWQAFVTQV